MIVRITCALLLLGVSFVVPVGGPLASARTISMEIPEVVADITQLIQAIPDKNIRSDLLDSLALAHARGGNRGEAMQMHFRHMKTVQELQESNKAAREVSEMLETYEAYGFSHRMYHKVRLLSALSVAAVQAGETELGLEQLQEASKLVEAEGKITSRVEGYRIISKAKLQLHWPIDQELVHLEAELDLLTGDAEDPLPWWLHENAAMSQIRHNMIVDIVAIAALAGPTVVTKRIMNKALCLVNIPVEPGKDIYLLRRLAEFQAKLGQNAQAMDSIKQVFAFRKAHYDTDAHPETESSARYIADLCAIAMAQVEIGERALASQTFQKAWKLIEQFPPQLQNLQFAWRWLARAAWMLGKRELAATAEGHIFDPYFQTIFDPSFPDTSAIIKYLVRMGQLEAAKKLVRENYGLGSIFLRELLAVGDLAGIQQAASEFNGCGDHEFLQIVGRVLTQQAGVNVARSWVDKQCSVSSKVHGLIGILEGLYQKK